ncbi:MAG: 50S ribosomal protein L29 [Chloroflexota bacterium]|nr:50S ribosomal protein L29 [Chloroflexota bacterium]
MKIRELRTLSDEKLLDTLEDQKEAMFNFRFQKGFGQLEDQTALKKTRQVIARIKTVITERERAAQGN